MTLDPVIPLISSLVLSYIFVVASIHKWKDLAAFKVILENYQILPTTLLGTFTLIIPAMEIATGVALLIPILTPVAAILAASLLLMYMLGIGINLLKGRRTIDCGCGGTDNKQAISEWLLVRNGILLFLVMAIILPVVPRSLVWLDWAVVLMATLTACLMYNVLNQLLMNRDLLKILRSGHG